MNTYASGARLAEGDLQRPLENLALLADELVAAAAAEQAVAVGVGVRAVRRSGGLAVDEDPERDRLAAPADITRFASRAWKR